MLSTDGWEERLNVQSMNDLMHHFPNPRRRSPITMVPCTAEPVGMTEEQKFLFDLKGWILIPAVLE